MTRNMLRFVAHLMVLVVLLAQVAVAAYACPALLAPASAAPGTTPPTEVIAVLANGMAPDCADMAARPAHEPSVVCAEHCKTGQQSDRIEAVSLASAALGNWYLRPAPAEAAPTRNPNPARTHAWAHALALTAPPHAIVHCVRRT